MAKWLRRQCLRDMKCNVHGLEVMSSALLNNLSQKRVLASSGNKYIIHDFRQCPAKYYGR